MGLPGGADAFHAGFVDPAPCSSGEPGETSALKCEPVFMFVSGFPSLLLSLRPPPLLHARTTAWGLGVSDPPPSPSSHRWSTIPERGPAHQASTALTFPRQHTASSLYTCQPPPSRPCLRSSLALDTFPSGRQAGGKTCQVEPSWDSAGGKKRGPVVQRWRGVRVFHWSGSAAGAPASQTSERAPSGRSGGRIYITHVDTGKH